MSLGRLDRSTHIGLGIILFRAVMYYGYFIYALVMKCVEGRKGARERERERERGRGERGEGVGGVSGRGCVPVCGCWIATACFLISWWKRPARVGIHVPCAAVHVCLHVLVKCC